MRIAIVVPPFAPETSPALGPSLLRAVLERLGHECSLYYLNLEFAAALGLAGYREIDRDPAELDGEALFSGALFGEERSDENSRLARRKIEEWASRAEFLGCDVIGFSSSYQTTVASLVLAKALRTATEAFLVMGGANCEGVMGQELLERFDFLDAVFSGEADETFPSWIEDVSRGEVKRGDRRFISPTKFVDLDSLPAPDFSDYFRSLERSGLALPSSEIHLAMETARGCFWGEKSHCSFCGLNGEAMSFRVKSPARIAEEVEALEKYPVRSVLAADNIVEPSRFAEAVRSSQKGRGSLYFFVETRARLSRRELEELAKSGVRRIQAGIESLSGRTLARIGKGTTPLDGIHLLREAARLDVAMTWNLLWGFPGEDDDDYAGMNALLPLLRHLHPPTGLFEVRLHRFSTYHSEGTAGPLRPAKGYGRVFPFPDDSLERLAYFFERESPPQVTPALATLAEKVREWRLIGERGGAVLLGVRTTAGALILDARAPGEEALFALAEPEYQGLRAFDEPTTVSDSGAVREIIENLAKAGLLAAFGNSRVGLVHFIEPDAAEDPEHALRVEEEVMRARMRELFGRN